MGHSGVKDSKHGKSLADMSRNENGPNTGKAGLTLPLCRRIADGEEYEPHILSLTGKSRVLRSATVHYNPQARGFAVGTIV